MRNLSILFCVAIMAIIMTGCGVNASRISNSNSISTNVELNKANFIVLERVSGEASSTYIMGIGGFSNQALIDMAKSNMMDEASLEGSSKAIINVTTDIHRTMVYPFYFKKKVIVSAYVIEFTE